MSSTALTATASLMALLIGAGLGRAQTGGGFDLSWGRAVGGSRSTGGGWEVQGTAGQPDAGQLSGGDWVVQGGFWNRVSGNLAPAAHVVGISRTKDLSFKIRITDLMTNAFDPDGETPLFASASGTSTNGAVISAHSGFVFYNPPGTNGNVADLFNYRVKDAFQGQGAGTVLVTILNSTGPSQNVLAVVTLPDGNKQVHFAGIPGFTYLVQAATNLTQPVFWVTLSTNAAGSDGLWSYTDLAATNFTSRYYRSAAP